MQRVIIFTAMILVALFAEGTSAADPAIRFEPDQYLIDLTQTPMECVADSTGKASVDDVRRRTDWRPIRIGKRWDEIGRAELRGKTVWVRARLEAPEALRGQKIGFYGTACSGSVILYVNGQQVGEKVQYDLGRGASGPFQIPLDGHLNYGKSNELLMRLSEEGSFVRVGGLLGSVRLYRSLPFRRTASGGLETDAAGPFSVLLHLGDALMARGGTTRFSAEELRSLDIPMYALREDELILLAPADALAERQRHAVELTEFYTPHDDRAARIQCEALPAKVARYEKITLPIHLEATYTNPFLVEQIEVTARVVTPSGKVERMPAFFAQDYRLVGVGEEEEILLPTRSLGTPWRAYYRPREVGAHKMSIEVRDRRGSATHDAGGFETTPSDHPGFLRISRDDPRFFEYDNGDSFYGTGPSGWYRGSTQMFMGNPRWVPLGELRQYYRDKGSNRSTYEYLAIWHFGSWYLKGGWLDPYVLWKQEEALRSMEANGLRWIVYGTPGKGRIDYKGKFYLPKHVVIQGGSDRGSLGFDPAGRIELRHMVARMADSPSIWIWHCGEEESGATWMIPYHDYIRKLDVYDHPHAVGEGVKSLTVGSDVILHPGWYNVDLPTWVDWSRPLANQAHPVIMVEGGIFHMHYRLVGSLESGTKHHNAHVVAFHNHLWGALFMKHAAGGTEWLNRLLHKDGALTHAKALSRFLDGESLTRPRWKQATPKCSDAQVMAFVLQSDDATWCWAVNRKHTWKSIFAGKKVEPRTAVVLEIPVTFAGPCMVEIWDTQTGKRLRTDDSTPNGGKVKLTVEELPWDMAVKVRKK